MDALIALAESGVREQAARECRRFADVLDGLDPAGWRTPVPTCGEWTVRDLTAHVAWVAEMLGQSVQNSLAGKPGPIADDFASVRARVMESKRAMSEEQLLTDFRTRVAQMAATLDRVRHDDLTLPGWHPAGMWTVARLIVQWLWEVSLHRYDLTASLGRDSEMDPASVTVDLDYIPVVGSRYLNPKADPDLTASYRAATRDPERNIVFRFASGTAEVLADDQTTPADVTFRSDGQTWLLAFVNRIDRAGAMSTGKIRVEGDAALAERFWACVRSV